MYLPASRSRRLSAGRGVVVDDDDLASTRKFNNVLATAGSHQARADDLQDRGEHDHQRQRVRR